VSEPGTGNGQAAAIGSQGGRRSGYARFSRTARESARRPPIHSERPPSESHGRPARRATNARRALTRGVSSGLRANDARTWRHLSHGPTQSAPLRLGRGGWSVSPLGPLARDSQSAETARASRKQLPFAGPLGHAAKAFGWAGICLNAGCVAPGD